MSANTISLMIVLSLLMTAACTLGGEDALNFPTYPEGEAIFPTPIQVAPAFSGDENYGLVASSDTLYYMELRHGRIHGKTAVDGEITGLAIGEESQIFVTSADRLHRIDNFAVTSTIQLSGVAVALTVCGSNPVILLEDGSLAFHNGTDLGLIESHTPEIHGVTFIQGYSGLIVLGYSYGRIQSLAVPGFSEVAAEDVNGSLLFLTGAGDDNLIFSTDAWNEVALCSPEDLMIMVMFTFAETPISAASDSKVSCIYGVCPSMGIQVCLANGEIAWKTRDYGTDPTVVLSEDCETALVACGNRVTLLLK